MPKLEEVESVRRHGVRDDLCLRGRKQLLQTRHEAALDPCHSGQGDGKVLTADVLRISVKAFCVIAKDVNAHWGLNLRSVVRTGNKVSSRFADGCRPSGRCQPRVDIRQDTAQIGLIIRLRDEGHIFSQQPRSRPRLPGTHHYNGGRPSLPDIVGKRDAIHRAGHLDVSEYYSDLGVLFQDCNSFDS